MSSFTPADPSYAARVRRSFERQGLMAHLGAELLRVEPGLVEIALPWRRELTQQHGYFHAGATTAVADSAGGYAAYSLFPVDSSVLTVEFKINLLAPAEGERLRATGRVVKPGRTLTVCELEVLAERDGGAKPCAWGIQTVFCLLDRPDEAARD
ncbi:MAG: PaaI family thioesterase [Kiloniellales bacterium]